MQIVLGSLRNVAGKPESPPRVEQNPAHSRWARPVGVGGTGPPPTASPWGPPGGARFIEGQWGPAHVGGGDGGGQEQFQEVVGVNPRRGPGESRGERSNQLWFEGC